MGRRSCEDRFDATSPSSAYYGTDLPQAALDITKKKSKEFLIKKKVEIYDKFIAMLQSLKDQKLESFHENQINEIKEDYLQINEMHKSLMGSISKVKEEYDSLVGEKDKLSEFYQNLEAKFNSTNSNPHSNSSVNVDTPLNLFNFQDAVSRANNKNINDGFHHNGISNNYIKVIIIYSVN